MGIPEDTSQAQTGASSTNKRKRAATSSRPTKETAAVIDLTATDDLQTVSPTSKKKNRTVAKKGELQEKRLRRFRVKPPGTYLQRLERARTQRMFVIDRCLGGTEDIPEMTIEMAGTTGNVYIVTISKEPSCTCPDSKKGNQCKHIVYVLHNVLKAPEDLQYQLAFLSAELREMFAAAPIPASNTSASSDAPSNRKEVSGDCPICFTEFDAEIDDIVWCKAACGNNIHRDCFEQWAKSQAGKQVNCVYCRTPWQGDEESIKRIASAGKVNKDGYVNVAGELGLSGVRDYSTYHQYWVRQQGWGRYGYEQDEYLSE